MKRGGKEGRGTTPKCGGSQISRWHNTQDTYKLSYDYSIDNKINLVLNKLQRCHGSAPFGGAASAGATARVIAGAIEKPQSIEDFRQGRSDEGERGRPRWRAHSAPKIWDLQLFFEMTL